MDIIKIISFLCLFLIINTILRAISRNRDLRKKAVLKYLDNIIHEVSIERYYGIEYWFDKDKKTFLGQGGTREEVISHIKSRFPDHVFILENQGGMCRVTDWKLIPFEELKQLNFLSSERS